MNTKRFVVTIVEPTGVPAKIDTIIPKAAQTTEITAENTVTLRKFLKIRIEERAGKIISAVISKEPTKFIAKTIITAMETARIRLYVLAPFPVACAKFSSKVTAKILL